jgi:hypothetical protein
VAFSHGILLVGRLELNDEPEIDENRLICPKCGSTDIRRSRSEGLVGFFFSMLGRWPFRCRSCRRKFYHAPPQDVQA